MNWCRNDVVLIRIYEFSSLVALERFPEKPFPHRLVIFVSQVLGDNEEFEKLKCVFRYASSKIILTISDPRNHLVWGTASPSKPENFEF